MKVSKKIVDLALPHLRALKAYTPGLQPSEEGWVKLNTNENPYPPSPRVESALREALGDPLRLYPEPASRALRRAIARHHKMGEEAVLVGNGSDEILSLLARCFSGPERAVGFTWPSYSLYPVLGAAQGAPAEIVSFDASFDLPLDQVKDCRSGIFFLTSPHAPTGVGFRTAQIESMAEACAGLLVVDEAYADFADEDAAGLVDRYHTLCVVRTFSKSYSLAGARVGYLLAHPDLIGLLDRVRDSYNVNRLSQAAALAALEDRDYHRALTGKICETRDFYIEEFARRGWFSYPSQANFIFTQPRDASGRVGPEVARELYEFLCGRKVLVRYFPDHVLTSGFLRITVGTDGEMLLLTEAIDSWLVSGQRR